MPSAMPIDAVESSAACSIHADGPDMGMPPLAVDLLKRDPDIPPADINRLIPRCRTCDREHIEGRLTTINDGSQFLEIKDFMTGMGLGAREADRLRSLNITYQRAALFVAWLPYFAVWGRDQGQDYITLPRMR